MKRIFFYFCFLCFFASAQAFAGGLFLPGNGARSIGKGGAVIASGDDGDAVLHNPANLTRLKGFGFLFDSILTWQSASFLRANEQNINPNAPPEERTIGFAEVNKLPKTVFIPMLSVWYNIPNLGPGNLTLAAFGYGPNGRSGFEYPNNEPNSKCEPAEVKKKDKDGNEIVKKGANKYCSTMEEHGAQRLDFIFSKSTMIFFGLSAAYAAHFGPKKKWAIRAGGSFKAIYQGANQKQALIAASLFYKSGDKISNGEVLMELNAEGFAYTGNFGITIDSPYGLKLGISAIFPFTATLNGTADILVGPYLKQFGLLVEGNEVEAKLTFPWFIKAGISWTGYNLTVEVAVTIDTWSQQKEISLAPKNIGIAVGDNVTPIPSFGLPTNYRDSYSFRVGVEYDLPKWALFRLGWIMETGATAEENLNAGGIDFPNKQMFTVGASFRIPKSGLRVDAGFLYALPGNFNISGNQSKPVDLSPEGAFYKNEANITPTRNGIYKFGIMTFTVGLSGTWGG